MAESKLSLAGFPGSDLHNPGFLSLTHINPPFPAVFTGLPSVPWLEETDGIAFDRHLPNGVAFGGGVMRASSTTVHLELYILNGSPYPLTDITLQTCMFLRAIR
jgi:hypothetical protein